MINIHISPAAMRSVQRRIDRWHSRTVNRMQGELLNKLATRIAKQSRDRIREQGPTPEGTAWPPRVDNKPHPLLIKTGALLRSIRHTRESKNLIHIGPGVPYGKYHQNSDRKFIGISPSNAKELKSIIDAWVRKQNGRV